MKNKEKYAKEILEAFSERSICSFRFKYVYGLDICPSRGRSCSQCDIKTKEWLESEYEAPRINWESVLIDAVVLIDEAIPRHFAFYNKDLDIIACWRDGRTSKTSAPGEIHYYSADRVKLEEEPEETSKN